MKRTMTNSFMGREFYSSAFDTETGTLTRVVELPEGDSYRGVVGALFDWEEQCRPDGTFVNYDEEWRKLFGWRGSAFSPSPETIDISITDWCNFGCPMCYQSSEPTKDHAPKTLVQDVIKAFDTPPYQIAIGGGEPTAHPDFPWILASAREFSTVPNFTTAGHICRDEVFVAANKYCGGVALTYHTFKGFEYFRERYQVWDKMLDRRLQLNIHINPESDDVVIVYGDEYDTLASELNDLFCKAAERGGVGYSHDYFN